MANETLCAAPVLSICPPLSSSLFLPCCLHPVCVCKLCIQTAATFRCWKCPWFLHLRPANRFTSSLPVVPTSHLQPQSAWEFGVWNVLWLLAGFLALPSSLWGKEEEEENLQLVLCNKLSFVFCFDLIWFVFFSCLSVQDLQLLKSALPLIKPCSLQPDLCMECLFCLKGYRSQNTS